MKLTGALLRQFLLSESRNTYSIFWNLAFPLILMTILILIFSNMFGSDNPLDINVGLVNKRNEEAESQTSIAAAIEQALIETAVLGDWLNIYRGESEKEQIELLSRGRRHAVVVIPEEIDSQVMQSISMYYLAGRRHEVSTADVLVYAHPTNQISAISADIVQQIVAAVNLEINKQAGLIDDYEPVLMQSVSIDPTDNGQQKFSFADYLVPGIILMSFLSIGFEFLLERLTLYREQGVLRRFFVTPMKPSQYSLALILHAIIISLLQVLVIYFFGKFVFDIDLPIFNVTPIFFIIYSLVTLLSVGVLIAGIAKTANAANTLSNILVYPLMFLGGLYFPVAQLPFPISLFVAVNPVTYLSNGLRDSLGVFPSPTAPFLNYIVPAVWIVFSLVIGLSLFRWDLEGGKND